MFFVYVLVSHSKELRFYVGMSENPEQRLLEHNSGKTKSTKGFRPWQIFFLEKFSTRGEARDREKFLKAGSGKEKIKRMWSENKQT